MLKYQGKVPKRAGSLAKKNRILEASLEIIRDEGLRGVRHRAVAELAGVPLAATTYYFKNINELIVDSFIYFMEKNISLQNNIFSNVANDFDKNSVELVSFAEKEKYFHELFYNYLTQQISDKASRIIERSFTQYASRIPELATSVLQLQSYFEQQTIQMLQQLNVSQAEYKAHMILAFISFTEERALLSGELDNKKLSENIKLFVKSVFS